MIEIKEGEKIGHIKHAGPDEFFEGIERNAPAAGAAVATFMDSFPDEEKGAAMTALTVCVIGSVIVSCMASLKEAGHGDAEAQAFAAQVVARLAAVAHRSACTPEPTKH
jgi:hypothetical protein